MLPSDAPAQTSTSLDVRDARPALPLVPAVADDVRDVLATLSSDLDVPLALLSRGPKGWRFEAEAFPEGHARTNGHQHAVPSAPQRNPPNGALSGLPIGEARGLEWTLVVPGNPEAWQVRDSYDKLAVAAGHVKRALARTGKDAELTDSGMYSFARRLSQSTDPDGTHSIILKTIAQRTGACVGALAMYREQDQALSIAATFGYPSVLVEHVRIAPGEGILGTSFVRGYAEIGEAPQRRRQRYRTNSYMVVPLKGDDGPVGVVALTDKKDDRPFDRGDLTNARVLAAVAELGLARDAARTSMAEVKRLAAVDAVTGLFTRRYFDDRLAAEVQRAHRHQEPLALLLADIDYFKRVNDKYGHPEGDRALRTVADVLRDAVRVFDVCARLGGDEFVILMPRATLDVALRIAERIRERVQQRFERDAFAVTISIGAATLQKRGSGPDLVGDADRRLRAAKQKGKNTVQTGD